MRGRDREDCGRADGLAAGGSLVAEEEQGVMMPVENHSCGELSCQCVLMSEYERSVLSPGEEGGLTCGADWPDGSKSLVLKHPQQVRISLRH